MIEDLCRRLKEKRGKLGYSLEKVVENTKLHPSVIKAIENCRLNEISPIYLKGFIKIYASFLKVDIGDDFKLLNYTKASDGIVRPNSRHYKHKVSFIKPLILRIRRNIVFVVVLLISFVVIIVLVSSIIHLIKHKTLSPVNNKKVVEAVSVSHISYKGKGVVVSIKAKRDCFIRTKRDGKIVFEGSLGKGVVESWQASRQLEFSINDGSSVIVEVNGRVLPSLSKIHKPIKNLKITPKNISIVK